MAGSILNLIKSRRSVRRYTSESIPQHFIIQILEAGRWAPSGLNNQPWKFVVIRDCTIKSNLARLTTSSNTIRSANTLIAIFLDKKSVYNMTKDVQAIGACIQNMLLEIHSIGLGACWLGEILNKKQRVNKILKIPSRYELMAILSLGWPKKYPHSSRRKRLKQLIMADI